ncbi:MAG: gamma carbonic anhydrase family protein [Gammaproteobacteria bacterium]|nr:gamma carbonic anhydrase family protein [Gammaproteobacteria bacterium]
MAGDAFEGKVPCIAATAYVDDSAKIIGDVTIGRDSSVWPMVVIRGDVNSITIGDNTNIQDCSVMHVTHGYNDVPDGFSLSVGDNVTVGHGVILHGCLIEDNCLIGMGSTMMDGVVVHPYVMVGAGSLVSPGKTLDGGFLWLGTPARKVRELTKKEYAWIDYSATHYVNLKNRYMDLASHQKKME